MNSGEKCSHEELCGPLPFTFYLFIFVMIPFVAVLGLDVQCNVQCMKRFIDILLSNGHGIESPSLILLESPGKNPVPLLCSVSLTQR